MTDLRTSPARLERVRLLIGETMAPLLNQVRSEGFPDATAEDVAFFFTHYCDGNPHMVPEEGKPAQEQGPKKTRTSSAGTLSHGVAEVAASFGDEEFSLKDLCDRVSAQHPTWKLDSIRRTFLEMAQGSFSRT